ncbi:MED6 mediator sub complex component-domain-containing protein [Pyronema domesticum]|uniref:Mediator of RNA polymerase II transcription subunit 6 n=1 Tax=Pyronema omphalodes (strain CBS 100304) TaxID=1076935 RepID=U4L4E8_PYROM|nr:MED6 mediator sub complex component-domain-containing protein [Pyronema domesticum]CCX11354.1 Similar to Mediator of RNA polymerase II transcription subunit 6; acc. no. A2R4I0 [Pyronema omphalodes CBS 100304]
MADIPRPRTPLDETTWRYPQFISNFGPLNENLVMHYFYESSFYDPTSSNGQLMAQINRNPAAAAKITSNHDFFEALKKFRGTEYILTVANNEAGIFVIRKQIRKAPRDVNVNGRMQKVEDVSVVQDYFIVGENIYQAPLVGAVVQNRLLTITRDLRETLKLAMEATSKAAEEAAIATTTASATPATSQQPGTQPQTAVGTPTPGGQQPGAQQLPQKTQSRKQMDEMLLRTSLELSAKFGDEFMDDHAPLLDNPGSMLATGAGIKGPSSAQDAMKRGSTPVPPRPQIGMKK